MEHKKIIDLHSVLAHNSTLRKGLRTSGANTVHLDRAGRAISKALGDKPLSAKNFGEVMALADKKGLAGSYSSGVKLKKELGEQLGIKGD
ncbi:MAG: hypothetical protein WC030_01765 [Candidatus Paceibacterota bacterium]